tara:strand:+ start:729 stop:905 length:177 start_codon:yes stop_codon:yes gene_type:complete
MKINIGLIILITGILFITAGYAHQVQPSCEKGIDIKFVPRNVYDEIMQGKPYSEETNV